MSDADITIKNLLEANPLREPALRSVIQALHLPSGSTGLDAGCGIGLQARLLAEAVGPQGRVVGMDILPELLLYGKNAVGEGDPTHQIAFCAGDAGRLPFEEGSFDWAWSADCIGYPAGELGPLLVELKRVVKPGGSIILLAWSSQQLLPGYPLLEARLNAACSSYIPYLKGTNPEMNFLRALGWFQKAGLEEIRAQTFVGEVQAPLSGGERLALSGLFQMLWGEPQQELPPLEAVQAEDWNAYRRLCTPGSADFILDLPDYYAFFTYSLFRGKAPRRAQITKE